jgi:hypothetical protein
MDSTRQTLFPGNLLAAYQQELKAIREEQLLKRLWAQDTTVWPAEEAGNPHLKTNLEFLHIPERLPQILAGALHADSELQTEGLTDRVVIAFGSVHHFCEAVSNLCPDTKPLKFIILDSCHPGAIRQVESQADTAKMLVALVNKSAYRLEDHALFLYFQKKLQSQAAGSVAGQFVAASDAHTFLGRTAAEYHFRYFLELPSGIAAPYCSVIHLTLLLKVFAGVDLEVLQIACREMLKRDAFSDSSAETPASDIAAFLSATAGSGRLFVCFLASPALAPFASAFSRLVGGSIGKEGGLFSLVNTIPCDTKPWETAAGFVVFRDGARQEPEVEQCIARLRSRGIPFLEVTVADPLDLVRHTFRWQIATALASARMGLDPFDLAEPRLARTMAAEMLNTLSPQNDTLQRRPRIQEKQIQLFAEARARQEISQINLTECLVSFLERQQAASYLGLFVYLQPDEETLAQFTALREQLAQALKFPVMLAWGPRSLDTFGYLFREKAPQGFHLVVTGDIEADIKIPGAHYTFGQMYQASAIGHFEALSAGGSLTLRLHLSSPLGDALVQLQNAIQQALRRVAP